MANPIGALGKVLFRGVGQDIVDALSRKIGALPSNPFMAEVAAKSYMPKSTARAAREQGLDISQNQVRQIRDLKAQRAEGANFTDPLISAAATREFRTPTVIGQKNAADLEYHNNMLDRIMKAEAEQAARIATKDNLLFAAREARKLGYNVKKSTDRNGNVSSYYVETPSGDVRISDHELPYSPRRDFMATEHGQAGFSGFHGGELIVDHNTTLDDVLDTLIPKDAQEAMPAMEYPIAPINEWYGEANYQQTGGKMKNMSPDEFLSSVRPLDIDEGSRDNIDDLKNHMMSGRTLDPLNIFASGKEDGRHRAVAAKELGIQEVPVIIFGGPK